MNELKKQAYLRLAIIVGALALSLFLAFYVKNLFLKVPFVIISIGIIVLLVRLYISYKRKKLFFDGKVLKITPPKRTIGRYTVIMQNGKVSKRLYSYQVPKMKVGGMYAVAYEEKSLNILETQEAKFQMMDTKGIKKNPKFKM